MPPKPKFGDGEQVLCFHGPLLYEAKCVKSEVKDKNIKYLVHYNGWNKNWDEWVPESRVLKANEAGLQRQKELQQAHASKNKAARAARPEREAPREREREERESTPTAVALSADRSKGKGSQKGSRSAKKGEKEAEEEQPLTPAADERRKTMTGDGSSTSDRSENVPLSELAKRKRTRQSEITSDTPSTAATPASADQPKKKRAKVDLTVESEESFLTKIEVRVKIPEELKPWLVDDWDLICRQKQLVQLPCKQTVDTILDDYIKNKLTKSNNPHKDAIQEMTQGLREYFNAMLGTQLLYKFERPQYGEVMAKHPELQMSQIYGATHLLRLFVKLGGMLAYTPLDDKSVQLLLTHIHDFLKFLSRSANNLFSVNDYMVASPEHHRKAL